MTNRPRIIVGIDGTSRGGDALAFASSLATALGTGLLLVHAYGPDEHCDVARAMLDAHAAAAGDVPVEVVAYADTSPARALQRIAAAWGASIIVLGPSHRAGIGHVLPGSTGQQLLCATRRTVAVVPRGWRPSRDAPLRHIGCGYDGTAESEAALETAAALSRAVRGELDVMRAFWSAPLSSPQSIAVVADLERRAGAGLGEAVQRQPEDANARAAVLLNDPAQALIARSREVDLLVLGSRGKGPLAGIWAGSVSSRVIREAACPVLVVPRGVRPALVEPAAAQPA
jgi:nucleotide-binding universal stress UspA family protein